jgi:hypothetical protein
LDKLIVLLLETPDLVVFFLSEYILAYSINILFGNRKGGSRLLPAKLAIAHLIPIDKARRTVGHNRSD